VKGPGFLCSREPYPMWAKRRKSKKEKERKKCLLLELGK